ncbi:phytoene synthase [Coleofasciculus sp. FACHB-64]|jgi:phytoene synthase|uniref:15-cis-phytoene synthase CrtB n=1 Tax=Cyanophyceae TaxID=3028117 RepID=UPI0016871CFF|nr:MULTISPECIES: phytoene synthase [unclassified Coleofasciculus]MBD1837049.1 phytoene synthase [Coleofasciculus sp. FACHB-501]MBD1877541.1 phytoene synthase [Coleofasciculus sp. FACHB-T130]MBD1891711.1 phytoene synthase [Coleofasciculus sp. FACHB-SPT9]MBD1898004.1 phytoene synthase [Coleofasciculus sp. FACHB-129]MBD1898639.1 phytoene synthase [Coleofasciculus sp. FACHB-125]
MLQLSNFPRMRTLASIEDAYQLCRQITAKYAKTFYLGTLLMPAAKRRAIWAIYAWCRRTDELVDGASAAITTPETLDRWEKQLESVFAGEPLDDPDVALVDTLKRFPMDIEPFRDMIAGQRMDLYRSRYKTFEELNLYCYRVAGTVGLMSTAVMGVDTEPYTAPWKRNQEIYIPTSEAIALGIANQLTNILRDVGEDARRGRIYLPLEELALFNYTEQDLMNGVVDERWRELMRFQIQRARKFYVEAEQGIGALSPDARWPVAAALMLYSQILDRIERNQYDVFSTRAYVPTSRKLLSLPAAWLRAQVL